MARIRDVAHHPSCLFPSFSFLFSGCWRPWLPDTPRRPPSKRILPGRYRQTVRPVGPGEWLEDRCYDPFFRFGGKYLEHSGSSAATAVTPGFSLDGAGLATFTYSIRRTGSYDRANLRVTASIDGGGTFPTLCWLQGLPYRLPHRVTVLFPYRCRLPCSINPVWRFVSRGSGRVVPAMPVSTI